MSRKKKSSKLGTIIGTVVVIALICGCIWLITANRLFGSYKSEAAGSLFGMNYSLGSVEYTFSGLNTVTIETEMTLFGTRRTSEVAKYKIHDNEITFTFTEEKKTDDGKTEKVDKDYTYSFYRGKDSIKIDNTEYKKVK